MAAGAGDLGLATVGLVLVIIVLALFERLQDIIDKLHQKRSYRFQFATAHLSQADLDTRLRRFPVSFTLRKVIREAGTVSCWYDVWGSHKVLEELSAFFVDAEGVLAVEYSG
jgi:uncharacterized membrane protein YhiD involved in acid resistance